MADRWTIGDDQLLTSVYEHNSKKDILQKMNKDWMSIRRRAHRLGLSRDKNFIDADKLDRTKIRKDSYTSLEIDLLKKIFNNRKEFIIAEFEKQGFERSWESLNVTARKMGIRRNQELIMQEMVEAGSKAPCPPNKVEWAEEEDETLLKIYSNSSQEDSVKALPGRTWKAIRERAVKLGLSRDDKVINIDRQKHFKENMGVDSSWQLPGVREKSRQTNLARRGVEYPTQSQDVRDKVKKTVQGRYGVGNVFQSEEIKKEIVKTNLEKLGVENPQQNADVKKKTEQTNLEKYGVSSPFQMIDRVQLGMKEKYGEVSPLKVPEIKERQRQTNIEKYGFPVPSQNKEVQGKFERTSIEKFGYKTPFLSPIIKQKIKETNLKKYGVNNPAQAEEIKEKIKKTTFERYGVNSFLELRQIREKGFDVRKGRKTIHKSGEEIKFIEYLKIFDPQTEVHVEHPTVKNVMDFYMPKFDLWIQYDGIYWHGKIKRFNVTRQLLKIQRTIKNDQYQNEHIPNLIRFWSDDVQEAISNDSIMNLIENKIIEKTSLSHQYLKRIETFQEDLQGIDFDPEKVNVSEFVMTQEKVNSEIMDFIIRYEWLGTIGVIPKWCFTARYKNKLGGVVFINEPTAYSKLLGDQTRKYEALIQRGASVSWAPKNLGSKLVMFSCNWMVENTEKRFFVGYADPMANELGTIYQACNFDYLGNNFGVSYLFKHPLIKNGKWFSIQMLKRTSSFKKWCKDNGIGLGRDWFKDNGFKDLRTIPLEIRMKWYDWNKKIVKEAEKLKVDKKHKYAIVIGKIKKEKEIISSQKNYTPLPYPKRCEI
jgi:hypothetical protein